MARGAPLSTAERRYHGRRRNYCQGGEIQAEKFNIPTFTEAGFPIENPVFDWRGLIVAKGTPPDVLQVLREGFKKAAEDPDYIALMDKLALPRT